MTTITDFATPSPVSFEVLLANMKPHFESFAKKVLCLRADNFDEAVQDLTAIAFDNYRSLVRRGKEIFYSPIVKFAIKSYRNGRHFTGSNSTDICSDRTQLLGRSMLCSLNSYDFTDDSLHFMVDPKSKVSDAVQFKIDFFETWYHLQTPSDKDCITDLALGYTVSEIAKKHGVTPSAICQRRQVYANSWKAFIDPPEEEGACVLA